MNSHKLSKVAVAMGGFLILVGITIMGIFALVFSGVIISSYFIVDSAVKIAEFVGVPKALTGATIIAFGTSLPEFSIDINAFSQGAFSVGFR